MNKSELIEHIAAEADISKAAATRALESTIDAITASLKKGDAVLIQRPVLLLQSKLLQFQSFVLAKP